MPQPVGTDSPTSEVWNILLPRHSDVAKRLKNGDFLSGYLFFYHLFLAEYGVDIRLVFKAGCWRLLGMASDSFWGLSVYESTFPPDY